MCLSAVVDAGKVLGRGLGSGCCWAGGRGTDGGGVAAVILELSGGC